MPEKDTPSTALPLVKWISRSYIRTSLLPLLIVELGLIALYVVANQIVTDRSSDAVRQQTESELNHLAGAESQSIGNQLRSITAATEMLRTEVARVMVARSGPAATDDPDRFASSPEGAYYTTRDNGGAALFYSGVIAVGAAEKAKAMRSAGIDPALKSITDAYPLAVQSYYNTYDSMNRIYPYFDVINTYTPKLDIPTFNFYYEADAAHNPDRSVTWTDLYYDPAGSGWMTSAIAPVYRGDFLEGVVGIDITVRTLVEEVLNLDIPFGGYAMLLSQSGGLIALPDAGTRDLDIHDNAAAAGQVTEDTFQSADKHIQHLLPAGAGRQVMEQRHGTLTSELATGRKMIAWATVPETGWKMLLVVSEANVLQSVHTLR